MLKGEGGVNGAGIPLVDERLTTFVSSHVTIEGVLTKIVTADEGSNIPSGAKRCHVIECRW